MGKHPDYGASFGVADATSVAMPKLGGYYK